MRINNLRPTTNSLNLHHLITSEATLLPPLFEEVKYIEKLLYSFAEKMIPLDMLAIEKEIYDIHYISKVILKEGYKTMENNDITINELKQKSMMRPNAMLLWLRDHAQLAANVKAKYFQDMGGIFVLINHRYDSPSLSQQIIEYANQLGSMRLDIPSSAGRDAYTGIFIYTLANSIPNKHPAHNFNFATILSEGVYLASYLTKSFDIPGAYDDCALMMTTKKDIIQNGLKRYDIIKKMKGSVHLVDGESELIRNYLNIVVDPLSYNILPDYSTISKKISDNQMVHKYDVVRHESLRNTAVMYDDSGYTYGTNTPYFGISTTDDTMCWIHNIFWGNQKIEDRIKDKKFKDIVIAMSSLGCLNFFSYSHQRMIMNILSEMVDPIFNTENKNRSQSSRLINHAIIGVDSNNVQEETIAKIIDTLI